MIYKKNNLCILYPHEKCDFCGYCEKYGLLDISCEEISEEDVCEEKIIERLIYESEREADLM